MSSNSEGDIGDYVTDNSPHEEGTLFLPSPDGRTDPWTLLFAGILAGLAGGVLVAISPRFGAALASIGYGLAAFILKGSTYRLGKALCFGLAITALLSAALIAYEVKAPLAVQHLVLWAGKRHLIFASFAVVPWALAALRLVLGLLYGLVMRARRRTRVQAASGA